MQSSHCNEIADHKMKDVVGDVYVLYRVITRPAADPFKTGMGTPATSVLPAYIFILHFELRLMRVFFDKPTNQELRTEVGKYFGPSVVLDVSKFRAMQSILAQAQCV